MGLENRADLKKLEIAATDVDGINATIFEKVKLMHNGQSIKKLIGYSKKVQGTDDEFRFQIESKMLESTNNDDEQKESESGSNPSSASNGLVAELSFFGHYREPQLLIPLQPFLDNATSSTNENGDETLEFMCRMVMDIDTKSWNVEPYSCPPYKTTLNSRNAPKSKKPEKTKEQLEEEKAEREAQRKIRDAYITKQRFASKTNKTDEELLAAKKEREAQRALRDAQRAKERMALKAMKRKQRKKEPLNDDSNPSNGNQPEDSSEPPLVLDDIEAPNGVEANPEDDTEISPVHRRPSDDKSPNPYRQHLSDNDTVSASNDDDLVSGDQ